MGNTFTSESAILNQVVAQLASVTGFNADTVFVAATVEWLDGAPGDRYIEVIPSIATDKNAAGEIGEVEDTFTVCLFWRLYSDQAQRDTKRIADATNGALVALANIEASLTNCTLAGLALKACLPERREDFERPPVDLPGWVMVRRRYKVGWAYSFPGQHVS